MADETVTETTDEATEVQETTEETKSVESVEDLPEWAQKELKRARDDAAKARQKSKSVADELKAQFAVREEELTTSREESLMKAAESEHELLKLRAALNAGVDASKAAQFAQRLQGEDEESLAEDAKRLLEVFGPSEPQYDRSQGQGSHLPLNGDPILEAFQRRLGI